MTLAKVEVSKARPNSNCNKPCCRRLVLLQQSLSRCSLSFPFPFFFHFKSSHPFVFCYKGTRERERARADSKDSICAPKEGQDPDISNHYPIDSSTPSVPVS